MTPLQRQCVEYMLENGPIVKLRDMQSAVTPEGEDWKAASSATRGLVKEGVLVTQRQGKHFIVKAGPKFGRAESEIETGGDDEVKMRIEAIRLLDEGGGLRVEAANPTPREMWAYFMKKFHEGELDLVFVPSRARTVAYQVERGTTVKIEYWDGLTYQQGKGHSDDVI